jgi:hypothetical protein
MGQGRALTDLAKKTVETQGLGACSEMGLEEEDDVCGGQIEIIDRGTALGVRYVFHAHITTRLRYLQVGPDQGNRCGARSDLQFQGA